MVEGQFNIGPQALRLNLSRPNRVLKDSRDIQSNEACHDRSKGMHFSRLMIFRSSKKPKEQELCAA